MRRVAAGEAAKEDIAASVRSRTDPEAIEVWTLDLASTASTLSFVQRVEAEVPRLDAVVLNAGINVAEFKLLEGFEQTAQVNVLSTFLLTLALLPRLRETSRAYYADSNQSKPNLVVVSSEAHRMTTFPEINTPNVYETLGDGARYSRHRVYQASKLLEVLLVRELVERLRQDKDFNEFPVVINTVNPGMCQSNIITDEIEGSFLFRILASLFSRSGEEGARTLVLAASAGLDSNGEYMSNGKNEKVEDWILTPKGDQVQKMVWGQTLDILEVRKPGVLKAIGL